MKELPILFSPAMVQAILEGRKTQTRRIINPQPNAVHDGEPYWFIGGYRAWASRGITDPKRMGTHNPLVCPYGGPGDRLWVKESHYLHGIWSVKKDESGKPRWSFHANRDMGVQFTEPNGTINGRSTTIPGWYKRNSLFMPRWASRLLLEIKDVRVERLQDISETDARDEGAPFELAPLDAARLGAAASHRGGFERLWGSINGIDSWHGNPWVWAIAFEVIKEPHGQYFDLGAEEQYLIAGAQS